MKFTITPGDVAPCTPLQLIPTPHCGALCMVFVSAAFISKSPIRLFLSSTALFQLANSFLRHLTALRMSSFKSFLQLSRFSVTITKTFRVSSNASSKADICVSFQADSGAHWCSGKMMAAILNWELCLLATHPAVEKVTQRSSLESPVTWIGFRQTVAL